MAVEAASFITDLNPLLPASDDGIFQADDHIRLIKLVLTSTFPNIDAAMTASDTELNAFEGRIDTLESTITGKVDKVGNGSITGNLTVSAVLTANGSINSSGLITGAGLDANGSVVSSVGTPVATTDATTKAYVDAAVAAAVGLIPAQQTIYPVGSVYINAGVATNPATLLGFGTWEAFGAGRVPIGVGSLTDGNSESKTLVMGDTGGSFSHTLTAAQMPAHKHTPDDSSSFLTNSSPGDAIQLIDASGNGTEGVGTQTETNVVGSGNAHPNMQPWVAVYMWKRTA